MFCRTFSFAKLWTVVVVAMAAQGSPAASLWVDPANGDLSNDRLNPTPLVLALGSNTVTASSSTGAADREYFTVTVPAGMQLTGVVLDAYSSANGISFVGFQTGSTMTVNPAAPDPTQLTGYTHFGFDTDNEVGDDFLPTMNDGLPGFGDPMGFTLPLPSGSYTFWSQQTNAVLATYTFDFQVVPEPMAIGMAALASLALLAMKRKNFRLKRSRNQV
jgi:hypothetical protein